MKPGTLPFSAFTLEAAEHLHKGVQIAYETGFSVISFKGAWVRHCFVLGEVRVWKGDIQEEANPLSQTLTLSTTVTPTELAHAFCRFGATVELLCREHSRSRYLAVVSATDGDRHLVHEFHDVAQCGHQAAPWLADHELGPLAERVQMCFECVLASSKRPKVQRNAIGGAPAPPSFTSP